MKQVKQSILGCLALAAAVGLAETGPFGGENIVANGSFEVGLSFQSGNAGYGDKATTANWTIGSNSGLTTQGNGSWSPSWLAFPSGTHCAFIQGDYPNSFITQTVNAPVAGLYRLSFQHAARVVNDTTKSGIRVKVLMDGQDIGYVTCWSMAFEISTFDIPLSAGEHVLQFRGDRKGQSADLTALIDAVALEIPVDPGRDLSNIDNYGFRFDFSGGTKAVSGARYLDDSGHPHTFTAVDGPNGTYTAMKYVSGWGTVVDGDRSLNGDWTLAMSCTSLNESKKCMVSLGGNGTKERKQLLVCTETGGRIYFAIGQNYSSGKNVPSAVTCGGLVEPDTRFHTLCCVHRKETNIICCFIDGMLVGRMDASYQSPSRPFVSGFQISGQHGGGVSGIDAKNAMVAFEDIRFYERALADAEVALYAKTFPARRPSQSPVATDVNPTADTTYPTDPTANGTLLVPPGVTVTAPALAGNYFNYGKIVLTGNAFSGAPRGPGVMRFTGSQTLNYTSLGNSPIELAGNVTIAASSIATYRSSPLTIESGTVTLAGQVNIGDAADSDYYDPYGAVVNFLGGQFAGSGFFYTGGRKTQVDINIPSGTFTARVAPWGATDSQGANRRVNVSGTGVFAPSSLDYNGGSAPGRVQRTTIRLRDGGTFIPPANWPDYAWLDVQCGAATLALNANAAPKGSVNLNAGSALTVTGGHVLDLMGASASLKGSLAVAAGTTVKIMAREVLDGALSVASTGKLVIDCTGHDGSLVVMSAMGGITLDGDVDALVELVNVPRTVHAGLGADGKTICLKVDDLTIPVVADWTGAGVAGKLDDPDNWTCYNANGEVLEGRLPGDLTFARVSGATNFQLPYDPAATLAAMDGATSENRMATICAHIQYPQRSDTADYSYMEVPYAAYDPMGEVPLTKLRDEAWKQQYLGWGQIRFDGWFKVTPEQAGAWALNQRFDDYYAMYFDGTCVLKNKTYTSNASATCTMTAGWHRFTLIVGDTYGGFGLTKSVAGEPTVLGVSINGGAEVAFESAFEQGSGPSRLWNRLAINSCQLTADADWRGVASFVDGAVIDLAGHSLTVSVLEGAAEITDSVGGGELHGDFNGSKNTSVALTGKLRFVKEGTGVFYAQKAGQSYTGGTEIRSGTVYFGTGSSPLGPKNSEIKVAAGAMLDMNGIISIYNYDTAGTIRMVTSTGPNGYNTAWRCFGPEFKLSGDAKVTGQWFYFGCPDQDPMYFTMNGHTLTLDFQNYVGIGSWRARDKGVMKFVNGCVEWLAGYGPIGVDIEVHKPANLKLGGNFDMGGFWYDMDSWSKNSGVQAHLLVCGVWKATAYRPPVDLRPGASIDLNLLDEPLDIAGGNRACASGANGYVNFDMGENATCYIDVSKRSIFGNGTKVIAWESGKAPANTTFALNEESVKNHFWMSVRSDGVYIGRNGITILVR